MTFACFVTKALMQRAEFDSAAAQMLETFESTYRQDRDVYSS